MVGEALRLSEVAGKVRLSYIVGRHSVSAVLGQTETPNERGPTSNCSREVQLDHGLDVERCVYTIFDRKDCLSQCLTKPGIPHEESRQQ